MDVYAFILIFRNIASHFIYLKDGVFGACKAPTSLLWAPDFVPHLHGRTVVASLLSAGPGEAERTDTEKPEHRSASSSLGVFFGFQVAESCVSAQGVPLSLFPGIKTVHELPLRGWWCSLEEETPRLPL